MTKKLHIVNKFGYYWELAGPWIISGLTLIAGFILQLFNVIALSQEISKILDAAITFSSIIVGFIGVLLAILFSLKDSTTIRRLFKTRAEGLLNRYFKESISSGFFLVAISSIMYLAEKIDMLLPLVYN